MNDPASIPTIPHSSLSTGKERWTELVALEEIRSEIQATVLAATNKPGQYAGEHYHWERDLRRGCTNVYGGMFRFFLTLRRRKLGNIGRGYALHVLALLRVALDIILPETPARPAAEPVPAPLRLYKPIRATNATVVTRGKAA